MHVSKILCQDSWPFLDPRRGSEAGIDLNTILEREYLRIRFTC